MTRPDEPHGAAVRISLACLLGFATLLSAPEAYAEEPSAMSGAHPRRTPNVIVPGAIVEGPADRARRRRLTERPDEERPEDQAGVMLFGRPLVIGGALGLRANHDVDPRLGTREDDRTTTVPHFELEIFYSPSDLVSLFGEIKYEYRRQMLEGEEADRQEHLPCRGETWIHVADPFDFGLAVQGGRQNLRDARRWWWDEDLDAVRLQLDRSRVDLELALARELLPEDLVTLEIEPEQRDVVRLLGSASLRVARRHRLEVFGLHQQDRSGSGAIGSRVREEREDEVDADLDWLGLRARGRLEGSAVALHYLLGAAGVRGEETLVDYASEEDGIRSVDAIATRDVEGWAAEGWLTLELALPGRPALTAGYALGSGSRDPDGSGFRQTGLHRNKGRFRGVTAFRYYGELLDPELSNLEVTTLGLGIRLTDADSIDLVYHRYRQHHASPRLLAAGLRMMPDGLDREIGDELDLVIGIESWEHRRIGLVGSVFRAGPAFGELRGELSYAAGLAFEVAF